MKIKVGDKVKVIAGSDKGKSGKVLKTLSRENRVVVEGVNVIKRHVKPNGQNEPGGIKEYEAPIHVSNVKLEEASKKEEKKTTKAKTTTKKETKAKEAKESKKTPKKAQKKEED